MRSEGQSGQIPLACSFCGKGQREVAKLIAGPKVYICDRCILMCSDIIAEERHREGPAGEAVLAYRNLIDEWVAVARRQTLTAFQGGALGEMTEVGEPRVRTLATGLSDDERAVLEQLVVAAATDGLARALLALQRSPITLAFRGMPLSRVFEPERDLMKRIAGCDWTAMPSAPGGVMRCDEPGRLAHQPSRHNQRPDRPERRERAQRIV